MKQENHPFGISTSARAPSIYGFGRLYERDFNSGFNEFAQFCRIPVGKPDASMR